MKPKFITPGNITSEQEEDLIQYRNELSFIQGQGREAISCKICYSKSFMIFGYMTNQGVEKEALGRLTYIVGRPRI